MASLPLVTSFKSSCSVALFVYQTSERKKLGTIEIDGLEFDSNVII